MFTRLLSALRDRTAPSRTLRGWLFGVAARVVKDYYRKQYRAEHVSLEESIPSSAASPDQTVEAMLSQERLVKAMSTLKTTRVLTGQTKTDSIPAPNRNAVTSRLGPALSEK